MMLVVSRPETIPLKLKGVLEDRLEVEEEDELPPKRLLNADPREFTDIAFA